jgi:hypothetical protein
VARRTAEIVLAVLAAAVGTAHAGDVRLTAVGPSPGRGVLVNRTVGGRPFDPVDPARPVVVVVHGLNPFHPLIHFTIGQRYGEALGRTYGASMQVFEWDWNAVTTTDLLFGLSANERFCEGQGRLLAGALIAARIDPSRVSFIGQSSGVIVAAAAARSIAGHYGRPIGRLTLLDPFHVQHELIFTRLAVSSCASAVDHYWVPGPSGFGESVDLPGVTSTRLPSPRRYRGLLRPLHSDHLHAVRWHVGRM